MRPSTVRRLVRTVPLAAVVAGVAGYALLPVEADEDVRPIRAAGPAPAGAASMRSALAAPVTGAPAPAPAAVLPGGFSGGLAAAGPGSGQGSGPALLRASDPDPAPGEAYRPALAAGGSASWPEEMPNAVAEQIDVSVRSLTGVWQTPADGSYLDFEVTWTNRIERRYDEVVPVVRVLPYDYPAAVARPGTTAKGMLDRKDLDQWREVKMNQPGVGSGPQQGTFSLDPGESRTVRYRLTLAAGGMSGRLPIAAEGWIGSGAKAVRAGAAVTRVDVTVAQPVGMSLGRPTDGTMGLVPSELRVELANADGFASHTVTPDLAATDPVGRNAPHGLVPQDLTAEVLVDGEWRRLQGTLDAEGLVRLDTSGLSQVLAPGESTVYRFRVNLPQGWRAGAGLELMVGHSVDGRAQPFRRARVPLFADY
ncbi:hypothetical protein [Kitasatospora purpeofusca]|uniref:hypothetical protein n=1 Tax=Kitasatospora purpeofusca TaxID=67352 RepID=UPI0036D3C60F